jgi:N-acetylglucosamine-6-phosphate deacetylase
MTKAYIESRHTPDYLVRNTFIHPQDKLSIDYPVDGFKLPGIIDIHFHGAFGWDFAFGDCDKIEAMLDQLLVTGLTGVFPTLITCGEEQRLKALSDIAKVARSRQTLPIMHGIYLEGPFLAPSRRGSHPENFLMKPSIELLEKWQKAADGLIKLITIAPELPGALEFISRASEMGVITALGHSAADWKTTEMAVEAGARHVTHLFNAMPGFHHRQANMLSFIMGRRDLSIELIGDCEHVAPEILRLTCNMHENSQIIFVSDAVAPAGLADGEHELYGTHLSKCGRRCCLPDGNLFGGATLLPDCLNSLNTSAELAWGLLGTSVWRTPCNLMGIKPPDTEVYFDQNMRWLASRQGNTWYAATEKTHE